MGAINRPLQEMSVFTLLPSIRADQSAMGAINRPLQEMSWISDVSGQSAGCNSRGAAKINLSTCITHTSREVAVHGCQGPFTRSQHTLMTPNAGTTTRIFYRCSRLHENFQVAQAHCFKIHLARGRYNNHASLRMKGFPTHDACC